MQSVSGGFFPLQNNMALHIPLVFRLFEKMIQDDDLYPKAY